MCSGKNCPHEVIWRAVDLKLQQSMVFMSFVECNKMIVPDHLAEAGIRQYEVTALFDSDDMLDEILDGYDLNWVGVEYYVNSSIKAQALGGVVFKRKSKGYFMLLAPCLTCYHKLASECNHDPKILKRASLQCLVHNAK